METRRKSRGSEVGGIVMHMVKQERERGISMEVDGRALEREGRVSRPQFVDELFEFLERQAARSMERKVSNEEGGMSEKKGRRPTRR